MTPIRLTKVQKEVLTEIAATGHTAGKPGRLDVLDRLKNRGLVRFECVGQIWEGAATQSFGHYVVCG